VVLNPDRLGDPAYSLEVFKFFVIHRGHLAWASTPFCRSTFGIGGVGSILSTASSNGTPPLRAPGPAGAGFSGSGMARLLSVGRARKNLALCRIVRIFAHSCAVFKGDIHEGAKPWL
jgi:hypothetical protein